jgi:hypothetical protein
VFKKHCFSLTLQKVWWTLQSWRHVFASKIALKA